MKLISINLNTEMQGQIAYIRLLGTHLSIGIGWKIFSRNLCEMSSPIVGTQLTQQIWGSVRTSTQSPDFSNSVTFSSIPMLDSELKIT